MSVGTNAAEATRVANERLHAAHQEEWARILGEERVARGFPPEPMTHNGMSVAEAERKMAAALQRVERYREVIARGKGKAA